MASWAETDGAFVRASLAVWAAVRAAAAATPAKEEARRKKMAERAAMEEARRKRNAEMAAMEDARNAAKTWRRLMELEAKEDYATREDELAALRWWVAGEEARTRDNRRGMVAEDWLEASWWRWRRSQAIVVEAEDEVEEVVVVPDVAEAEVVEVVEVAETTAVVIMAELIAICG